MNGRMRRTYSNTVDIVAFIKYILKRWYFVLLGIIIGIIVSIPVIIMTVKPVYTSEAKYYLTSSEEGSSYGALQATSSIVDDYLAMIKSRAIIRRAIDRNDLNLTEKNVQEMISVSNPDKTHLLVVKVKAHDQKQAEDVMSALSYQIISYIPSLMKGYTLTLFEEPKTSLGDTTTDKLLIIIVTVIFFALLSVLALLLRFMIRPTADDQEEISREFDKVSTYLLSNGSKKSFFMRKKRKTDHNNSVYVIDEILFNPASDRQQDKGQSKMIMITSPVGGEGKTLLAGCLFKKLKKEGIKAVLVDNDLVTISNKNIGGMKPIVNESIYSMEENGILQGKIDELKASYRYIIVDASSVLGSPKPLVLAKYCDKIVLIIGYGKTQMHDLRKSVYRFREKDLDVQAIVLNQSIDSSIL